MKTTERIVIALLLSLGLVGILWSASRRVAVERANRTVALCLDDLEVRQLAALTGTAPESLLQRFKTSGATHVAVSEQTLGEMLQTGRVQSEQPGTLLFFDRETGQQLQTVTDKIPGWRVTNPWLMSVQLSSDGTSPRLPRAQVTAPSIVSSFKDLGVGFEASALRLVQGSGLGVVARPAPDYLVTPQAVEASLRTARATGAKMVVFNGKQVAGGAKLARQTAETLQRLNLHYGFVELVPQEGEGALAAALDYGIIRTHSVSQEEMTKTSPTRGRDRFVLGVTERNVRLCYVRLHLTPGPDLVQANSDYVQAIAEGIGRSGYALGEPEPFTRLTVPLAAQSLLALGVLGGLLWLLDILLGLAAGWRWGLVVAGVVVALAGPVVAGGLTRSLVALLGAVVFPALGVWQVALSARRGAGQATGDGCPVCPLQAVLTCDPGAPVGWRAAGLVLRATLLTTLGGLLVAGLLSSSEYLMQVAGFRGVKLAQLLPLLLVLGATLAAAQPAFGKAGGGWPALREGLREALAGVIRYGHALAVIFALGALVFMLMRSGNESAVEVSGLELKLRALLDQLLVVRPRTKEILIGYPALLVGLLLVLQGRPRLAWVWLTVGAIAQVSALNTFCHLHTPLTISLLRVGNGLIVGILIGGLWWALKLAGEWLLARVGWDKPTCAS